MGVQMNKYRISKEVDIEESSCKVGEKPNSVNALAKSLFAVPLIAAPVVSAIALTQMMDKDIKEIKTVEELSEYSCVEDSWKKDCIYVEHPRIPKLLIEASVYKDFILKNMMAEIFDYITDRIAVKKIVLGLENKGKMKVGASVPINSLVADAKITGSLNSSYVSTMENVSCTNDDNKEYPWLKYYPDIVAAVKKNAGKMEIKQSIKMNLEVGLGLSGAIKGAFSAEQEYSFYVYYEKAE